MRYGHTAVLIEDTVYIWGGVVSCNVNGTKWMAITGNGDGVLHAFDVDTHGWFKPQVSGNVPGARSGHSACVLEKVMFVHGGHGLSTRRHDDINKLDTAAMAWSLINTAGTTAPASSLHSATAVGTKMFVFGGDRDQRHGVPAVRVFDTETERWLETPPERQPVPPQQRHHAAFAHDGELYIFGGCNAADLTGEFNDLWRLDSETLSWRKVQPQGRGLRWFGKMYCCRVGGGDRVVLFGTRLFVHVLHLSPGLKSLCQLAVLRYGLEQAELAHNSRWELAAMATET